MKRLRHWLFNFAAAVSMVACTALTVLFTRGWWRGNQIDYAVMRSPPGPDISVYDVGIESGHGGFCLRAICERIPRTSVTWPLRTGWIWSQQEPVYPPFNGRVFPGVTFAFSLGYREMRAGPMNFYPLSAWFIVVPAPFPILMTAISPFISLRLLRKNWIVAGHCPACGYDLRATPDKCPECGREPDHLAAEAIAVTPRRPDRAS